MEESLHYLLMTDYLLFQKAFLAGVKETNLTPGQPKILDYLLYHDGVVQKEIASACHIEPATMTSVWRRRGIFYGRISMETGAISIYI